MFSLETFNFERSKCLKKFAHFANILVQQEAQNVSTIFIKK